MSTEENQTTTRRTYEEVFNQGNLAAVDELFTSDFIYHTPSGPIQGPEQFKDFVSMYRTAFPDLHLVVVDIIAEGDKVVSRWTTHVTHGGPLLGIPATGRQVTITGIVIGRFEGGKFAGGWLEFDALGMLQQLGVVPASGQASERRQPQNF